MADTFFGTMYTSDDRGILFSKSLERHLFDGQRKSDFTNITSLRGVYLTNKLDDGRLPNLYFCTLCASLSHMRNINIHCYIFIVEYLHSSQGSRNTVVKAVAALF